MSKRLIQLVLSFRLVLLILFRQLFLAHLQDQYNQLDPLFLMLLYLRLFQEDQLDQLNQPLP